MLRPFLFISVWQAYLVFATVRSEVQFT